MTQEEFNRLNSISKQVIGAAIEVHRELGPGLLESVYEECLKKELDKCGINSDTQIDIPILYKGEMLNKTFRIDMLVEDELIIEFKAVDQLNPVYEAQLVTYLKLTGKKMGLLINFNVPLLKDGIKRKINGRIDEFKTISIER